MTAVRDATPSDAGAIAAIYNHVIATSDAIWRDEPVTVDDRMNWLRDKQGAGWPVLVAIDDAGAGAGEVVGFCALGPFRDWPGYEETAEHSIHLAASARGRGVGTTLLRAMIERARTMGKRVLVAGVDGGNDGSVRFHEQLGFVEVARMPGVGRKGGRSVDLLLLQRPLVYEGFDDVEDDFNRVLAQSLHPRGPDVLFDVIGGLGLPAGAFAVDIGCGRGQFTSRLVDLGFEAAGIDPVLRGASAAGVIDAMPLRTGSVDLVMAREMLYEVPDWAAGFAECRRILVPSHGRMVVYQLFSTDRLEPREAAEFWGTAGGRVEIGDRSHFEAAVAAGGLRIEQSIELATETGEWAEEREGRASRELLAAARLLRSPGRYIERYGRENYEIKLMDSRWHVLRMVGKLSTWIDVLACDD